MNIQPNSTTQLNQDLFNTIKALCRPDGVSGREQNVAAEILRQITDIADEVKPDSLGNVLAFKKGAARPAKRVMLAAHMDEVGFIVTSITDDGLLKFAPVGGVNSKATCGRRVRVSDKGLPGVVGLVPIHLTESDDKGKAIPMDKLVIDIGAVDREEAEKWAAPGDCVHFIGEAVEFGGESGRDFLAAKALDDRAGCAMMIEIMKRELPYDLWFAFTTQEEIGTRGAKGAAFSLEPDISIILETTASGDVSGVEGAERVTLIGGGAVVSYMDRGTIYDKVLYDHAFTLAKERDIPCQTKTMIAGGNDAGAISVSRGGVRTVAVSIPCRYLHSPCDMAKKSDIQAVYNLGLVLAETLPCGEHI